MNTYKRHRFPPDIISYGVWLYHRFNLSHRDIEDLLAERGIKVSYESIRLWCIKFGSKYARRLKRRRQGYSNGLVRTARIIWLGQFRFVVVAIFGGGHAFDFFKGLVER